MVILVPTDFSTCADNAATVAIDLAKRLKARVKFLHLMYMPVDWQDIPAMRLHLYPELQERKAKVVAQLEALTALAKAEGVEADESLMYHSSLEDFSEHIQNQKADLVVMGSHGASGWRELFVGSNAQRMLRYVPAPTLVVKYTQEQPLQLQNMALASTFSMETPPKLSMLLRLAEVFGANVHLVYINLPYNFEDSGSSMDRMDAFAALYPEQTFYKHIYNAQDEQKGLLDFCTRYDIDLLALATYGKSPMVQLFSPSLTENVVNRADFPVLALKA